MYFIVVGCFNLGVFIVCVGWGVGVNGVLILGVLVFVEFERLEVLVELVGLFFFFWLWLWFWLGILLMVGVLLMVGYWFKEILFMDWWFIEMWFIDL